MDLRQVMQQSHLTATSSRHESIKSRSHPGSNSAPHASSFPNSLNPPIPAWRRWAGHRIPGYGWRKARSGRGGQDGHRGALVTADDPASASASEPSRPRYQLSRRKAWFARPRTGAVGQIRPGAHLRALAARIAAESVPLIRPDGPAGDLVSPSGPQWNPLGPAGVCRGEPDGRPRVSGRVTSIAAHPGGKRAYAGPRAGGPGTPRTPACTGVAWTRSPRPRR